MEIHGHSWSKIMKLPISAIVLTYNEEKKIDACLKSLSNFAEDIFVVDSFSSDRTTEIVRQYTSKIFQHEFEDYGKQRNWALKNLPIKTEWILNLDADHRITHGLTQELENIFSSNEQIKYNGFLIPRKTVFMEKWIKHGGHYPVYHAVLFKRDGGVCEETLYDQHFIVNGELKILKNDIEDIVTESISSFISRHKKWALLEATSQILREKNKNIDGRIKGNLFGNELEKRRYYKGLYMKLPLFIRPLLYFMYRYFLKAGFLDGIQGLIFHFLQGFWFRFLVDIKIFEIKGKILRKEKTFL